MTQTERIKHYEDLMEQIAAVLNQAEQVSPLISELEAYYESPLWKEDYEADEAGKLPADLKRGVLSEDGVYNLLERIRETGGFPNSSAGEKAPDKRSFILGMITAFCECAAGGCKRLALSPPMKHEDFEMVKDEAYALIEKHGLIHYHEENRDQPEEARFDWIVIAGKEKTLSAYLALRDQGYSPVNSLEPFHQILSYQPEESIHTGYDAYRDYFG